MKLRKDLLYIFLVLFFCIISYINIIGNQFVWDDEQFIVERPEVKSFSKVVGLFTTDVYGIYRPARELVYYAAFRIFGLNPFFYHLFSIMLHSAAAVLLFLIIKKLFGNKTALLSSILFAVHPIHVERVANATGSFDIPGIILYLAAFYLYIFFREKNNKKLMYASIISFIFGLFASEEIITLPLLIMLYEFVFKGKSWKKYSNSIPYFILLGIFILFRAFVLKIGARVHEYEGSSVMASLLTIPKLILEYVFLTFFPVGLTPFRLFEPAGSIWQIMVPGLILIGFFYLVFRHRQNKLLVFFSGWFFITMLPFLNILPLQKMIAERYIYLASISIFILIAALINKISDKKIAYGIFAAIVIILIGAAWYNNAFWKDEYSLLSRGIKLNPADSKAHNSLGAYYFRLGDYEKAEGHFMESIRNEPGYQRAWTNLGVLYSATGQYNKSIGAFEKALQITPDNWIAYDKLGVTYMRLGDDATAEKLFMHAIALNKDYYPAYSRLATLYGNMGNYSLALAYLQKTLEINPYYAEAYYNLGILYEIHGQKEEAMQFYRKAYSMEPGNKLYAARVR